jgi:2-polyprenyl-3-methyl-5-hydroxy-6-metoxy-1,4-benzoquinol methylase
VKRAPTPLDYAAWRASRLGTITERLERTAILHLAGPAANEHVLDVGCGDGLLALALAADGARVTGLDRTAAALRAAAVRAAESGASLALVAGDASKLPFGPETFDLVVAVTVLCFVPSPRSAVEEIARVLKPGGRAVIGDLGRFSAWAAWRRLRGWLGDTSWQRGRFWSAAALGGLVSGAGLTPLRAKGAVFYPPVGAAAAALQRLDPFLGRLTTAGAAFVAIEAKKIRGA